MGRSERGKEGTIIKIESFQLDMGSFAAMLDYVSNTPCSYCVEYSGHILTLTSIGDYMISRQ